MILAKLQSFANGFFLQLPNVAAALLFLFVAWLLAKSVERAVAHVAAKRGRPDLGALLGSLAKVALLVAAFLFAAAIIFPSVQPADVFATLGIGSVAIGFAFKDILQNLLAGLLLLINRPYRRGDQIAVKGFEGSVVRIETRATIIRTYDGRRVIIPNSDVYTSAVIVNTAHDHRRDEVMIGIGYGDDPVQAIDVFLAAIRGVDGVLADPAPDVLPDQLNESTVDLKARWWADSTRSEQVQVRSRVVLAIFEAARKHGIDLPFPTQVMLFHDQTEDGDATRENQREGWPSKSTMVTQESRAKRVAKRKPKR
ncbi:MAG: mechanosensitive ion channel domain-containing protein [Sphingomicrobium sp.]